MLITCSIFVIELENVFYLSNMLQENLRGLKVK